MLIKIEFKDTEFTFNEINQDNIANVIHSEPGINILQSFLSIPTNSFLKKNDNKKPMIIIGPKLLKKAPIKGLASTNARSLKKFPKLQRIQAIELKTIP